MKNISHIIPGGKVRLRGKGSGFQERDSGCESKDPLQINVSVPSKEGYLVARYMLTSLLLGIYHDFASFTGKDIKIRLMEHPKNPPISKDFCQLYMEDVSSSLLLLYLD